MITVSKLYLGVIRLITRSSFSSCRSLSVTSKWRWWENFFVAPQTLVSILSAYLMKLLPSWNIMIVWTFCKVERAEVRKHCKDWRAITSMGFKGVPGWIWLGKTMTYNLGFLVGFYWLGLRPIILSSWFNLVWQDYDLESAWVSRGFLFGFGWVRLWPITLRPLKLYFG